MKIRARTMYEYLNCILHIQINRMTNRQKHTHAHTHTHDIVFVANKILLAAKSIFAALYVGGNARVRLCVHVCLHVCVLYVSRVLLSSCFQNVLSLDCHLSSMELTKVQENIQKKKNNNKIPWLFILVDMTHKSWYQHI